MTRLYLIRHAEAEGNLYRRIHGQYNSILTENGHRQLKALRARFADTAFDAVYSSDLYRAHKTAQVLCEGTELTVKTRVDLREVSMGGWEDQPWGKVEMEDPERMRLFRDSSAEWKVEGGESFLEMQARVHAAILDIAEQHVGQTVAVASHGTAIRFACAALLGLSLEESRRLGHSDNTAVTLVEVEDGKGRIVFADDNSHLPAELSTLSHQKWWKDNDHVALDENLWFEPMDFSQFLYKGLYLASRQEGWVALKRDMSYFGRQNYLEYAEECNRKNPSHLLCVMRRNTIVGILQLDAERDASDQAGYISFFYMLPEYRKNGLGIQLLGEAVSVFRGLGRDKLRLSCGEDNAEALQFYERHGFHRIAEHDQQFGKLLLLEKYIGLE